MAGFATPAPPTPPVDPMRILQRALPLALLALAVAPRALAAGQPQDGPGLPPAGAAGNPQEPDAEALEQALRALVGERADRVTVTVDAEPEPAKDWQERVDRVAKAVNRVVGAVLFYDIGESSVEIDASAVLDDPAALDGRFQELLSAVESRGFSLGRAEIELALPDPAATGEERVATLAAKKSGVPLAVLWLVLGAIFFTVRMGFVQVHAFGHAIKVTKGDYDNPEDEGEVSHFQALSAALSATVGLGNIAGVAIAISVGGPGATFWMITAGFLGMASKFTECSLGQMYRQQRPDGSVMGGAMYYLSNGLKELGVGGLGKFLAVFFAILCIGGSLAGGNSFQVNQSLNALAETIPFFKGTDSTGAAIIVNGWVYGAILTFFVGIVIVGGLRRIAQTAAKIVPTMCVIYVLASLFVILTNVGAIPGALRSIFEGAFTPRAGYGGMIGVLIMGFRRAAFSNEAGIGSAAIAHSAARTPYAVREGIVALLEPFIDTVVVCTMTALVIVITGAYDPTTADGVFAPYLDNANGAGLTSQAFKQSISWFPYILSVAVVLFAFSTMIAWSYYGERCWVWLFGDQSSIVYKIIFLTFVVLGSVVTATNALEFGDLMILGMALPNILGVVLLSGKVRRSLDEYMGKLRAGELPAFK